MKVIYEPIAERELTDAAAYIARRDSSIEAAEDLLTDAAATEDLIQQFPNSAPPLTKGTRRCLLSRHEYQIIYRVEGEIIRVYAFAHQKRKAGYWRKRVK